MDDKLLNPGVLARVQVRHRPFRFGFSLFIPFHSLQFKPIHFRSSKYLALPPSLLSFLSLSSYLYNFLSPDDPFHHFLSIHFFNKKSISTVKMQFTLITFATLLAVAFAAPTPNAEIIARAPQVGAETAAMSDASGNVVPFVSTSVNKPAVAA
ncbi:hypothetical protein PVAG01_03153 [Phlyctema vagabunda]|uniref:Uncharacterized protein n=1 Tax=Phlyctema vagabunda TaxID=108571 RepID=A0ABR4PSQ3_9HELO